ncbi:MAG: hypothetical protein AAF721_42085 [Myxococcota bacterium]
MTFRSWQWLALASSALVAPGCADDSAGTETGQSSTSAATQGTGGLTTGGADSTSGPAGSDSGTTAASAEASGSTADTTADTAADTTADTTAGATADTTAGTTADSTAGTASGGESTTAGSSSDDGTSTGTTASSGSSTGDASTSGGASSTGDGSSSSDGGSSSESSGGLACGMETCSEGENCLGEACSCIEAIVGDHVLRTDGTVVNYAGAAIVIENGNSFFDLEGIDQITDGHAHGCALADDGRVWCWSKVLNGNTAGELGNGSIGGVTPAWQAHPVQLAPADGGGDLTGVTRINDGSSLCYLNQTACAIRDDGTLWCWGAGGAEGGAGEGFFNDGDEGSHAYASQIFAAAGVPLDNVEAVTLGRRHACVLRNGGQVWCWGTNVGGPLGQGDQVHREYPVQVNLPSTAVELIAGSDVTCAHVGDNVFCWGSNNSGQVGIGDPASNTDGCINFCRLTPAPVQDDMDEALTGIDSLSGAYLANCVIRDDASLWCWGAQYSNVATPLALAGGGPITDVAMQTSCGSGAITSTVRYLTTSDDYYRATSLVAQECD